MSNLNKIEKVNALFLCLPVPPLNFKFYKFENSANIYHLPRYVPWFIQSSESSKVNENDAQSQGID